MIGSPFNNITATSNGTLAWVLWFWWLTSLLTIGALVSAIIALWTVIL